MTFKTIAIEEKSNGKLYMVDLDGPKLQLLFTQHSLDRIDFWSLDVEQVLDALLYPEEVVTGHFNRYIAHKRNNGHVVRAVYEYDENTSSGDRL